MELIPRGVRVSPQALPKGAPAPIAFRGGARIATADGSQPPALREATLRVDRGVVVDAVGLPVCRMSGRGVAGTPNTQEVKEACRTAIVGSGTAQIELDLPELVPPTIKTKLLLLNGGIENGITTLYVHSFVPYPVPRAVFATVEISRETKGQFGWRAEIAIPPIAGGSGSLRAFNLTARRSFVRDGTRKSFLSAKCPRGKLEVEMPRAVFRNEPGFPDQSATILAGRLQVPCTPLP